MHEPVFLVSLLRVEINFVAKHHEVIFFEIICARFQVTCTFKAGEVIVIRLLTFNLA